MTDYKSLVTTLLVERQNRLQLLQQNAAMYRENKRLQHLQDQNNRDSYLSNGWRKAEQPLHEQQLGSLSNDDGDGNENATKQWV